MKGKEKKVRKTEIKKNRKKERRKERKKERKKENRIWHVLRLFCIVYYEFYAKNLVGYCVEFLSKTWSSDKLFLKSQFL